jgi:hypothetical protein
LSQTYESYFVRKIAVSRCAHARSFVPGVEGLVGDEPRLRVGVGSTEILALWTHKAGPGGSSREAAPPSTHNNFFRAELNSRTYENRACAYAHAPSTSVRPSPVSSNPPVCHFASRRVSCVAAKATVEVGLASPFSSPRAAVARRAPAVSLDGATSLCVVMFDSVVLVKCCLSLN